MKTIRVLLTLCLFALFGGYAQSSKRVSSDWEKQSERTLRQKKREAKKLKEHYGYIEKKDEKRLKEKSHCIRREISRKNQRDKRFWENIPYSLQTFEEDLESNSGCKEEGGDCISDDFFTLSEESSVNPEEDLESISDCEEVKEEASESEESVCFMMLAIQVGEELQGNYKRLLDLVETKDSSDKFAEKKKVLIKVIKLEKNLLWLLFNLGETDLCNLNENLRNHKVDLKKTWDAYIEELEKDREVNQAALEREQLERFDDQQSKQMSEGKTKFYAKTPRFSESEIKEFIKEKKTCKKRLKSDKYWKNEQRFNEDFDEEDTGPSDFEYGYVSY